MAKIQPKYTPEFRRQMVELVRTGRHFGELSKELAARHGLSDTGVRQAARDAGIDDDA